MLIVQLLEFTGHIWKIGIEDGITFQLPPKPILHYCVERDVLFTIAPGDSQNLILGNVAVLGLKESIGPFREHRRVSGQVTVLVNHLVQCRPIDEVIIHRAAGKERKLSSSGKRLSTYVSDAVFHIKP